MDATGTGAPAFLVDPGTYAPVVIDGFTIQGGSGGTEGSGIYADYYAFPMQIVNNIIQNNAVGVYLFEEYSTHIEHNLFKTNNVGAAGSDDAEIVGTSGYGIVIYYPYSGGLAITENEFTGNTTTAMYVYFDEYGGSITGNTSENDGSFVIINHESSNVQFRHNQGKNFGAHGVTPLPGSIYPDAAIDIGWDSDYLDISDNDLEGGKAPINNGIAITNIFGSEANGYGSNVIGNTIKRFPGNGIVAESQTAAALYDSMISGNEVEDNGQDGILIEAGSDSYDNVLFGNKTEGNHTNDCEDDTTGSGTLATANTWFNNIGSSSNPTGLCTPGR